MEPTTRREPRIIFFDLETLPDLMQALRFWPRLGNFPGLTLRAATIICAGWSTLDDDKLRCINAWDFPEWQKDVNADRRICRAISRVLRHADVVVTHNGKSFDWRLLQTRLLFHKLPPLPKVLHVDTKQEAKKYIYSFDNKLETLAHSFTDERKMENGGWELWVKVWSRNSQAMETMTAYCKQDVQALKAVFNRLRPMMTVLPNANMYRPEGTACPNCGSLAMQKRGVHVLKESRKQRMQCMTCGSWSSLQIKSAMPRAL